MLSKRLADSKTLDEGRKEFANSVFETIREAILKGRDQ